MARNPETTFIYELIDPRTNDTRYIGKSNNPDKRGHKFDKVGSHRYYWIKELELIGLKPILKILDETKYEEWEYWEIWWIATYRAWGAPLTNHTAGGNAPPPPTEERNEKARKRLQGKSYEEIHGEKKGKELKELHRQLRIGYKHSEETIKKMSRPSHFKGKKLKPNLGTSKAILQFDKSGNFIKEFSAIARAEEELGISCCTIQAICKGRIKRPRFFIFKYKDNQ